MKEKQNQKRTIHGWRKMVRFVVFLPIVFHIPEQGRRQGVSLLVAKCLDAAPALKKSLSEGGKEGGGGISIMCRSTYIIVINGHD